MTLIWRGLITCCITKIEGNSQTLSGTSNGQEGKPWSKRRLADALGIETNQAIWNLENRDTELDIEPRERSIT